MGEQKETKMKPQLTEDEARDISKLLVCSDKCNKYPVGCDKCGTDILKDNGYIRKSDLEILIEEAEEMRKSLDINLIRSWCESTYQYILKSDKAFTGMKTELNKRKDK